MAIVENLIADFHNLQGAILPEKQRSFQHFLSTIREKLQNNTNEDEFIAKLQPHDNLEHLFRLDLLSYLKRNNELLEVLQSGNREHIGRVLKNFRFFAETIPTLSAETLVNDLFPLTSYVVKIKIINRIYKTVKNEQLLDEYYLAIEKKYGLRMAFSLLPGCSTNLIRLKIERYKPKLTSRHIIEIYKKDSAFPLFYFGILKKEHDTFDVFTQYPTVISYLSKKDMGVFWELQREFNFDFKSGKHLTKKLILQNQDVLRNGDKCVQWFQITKLYKTVIRCDKMEEFLLSFYRDTPTKFLETQLVKYSNISKILLLVPAEKRYALIRDLFNKKYSKDILNYQMLIPLYFLEIMSVDAREPIVRKHLEKSDDYIYLLRSDESVTLLKNMLQNCSKAEDRVKIIRELAKTARLNGATETVLELIQFMFERYRNDTRSLKTFIAIFCHWKKLEDLPKKHLGLLYQMAISAKIRNTIIDKISRTYLYHLIKSGVSFDDHLMEHLRTVAANEYNFYKIFLHDFKYEKVILERIMDVIDNFKDNEEAYGKLVIGTVHQIYEYNVKHKKNLIPFHKYKHFFERALQDIYMGSDFTVRLNLCYCVKQYRDGDLHKYYWEHYEKDYNWDMLHWYLKHDIKQIEEHIEDVLSKPMRRPSVHVFKALKKYATADIRKKIITYSESKLSFDNVRNSLLLVNVLSWVDAEGFLKLTGPFMPPADGVLSGDNIANKKYLQTEIIHSLGNIQTNNLFDIVKTVCVGDFLKYGLQPLYKLFYNTREIDVLPLLNDLKSSPVSLKKHSLLLSKRLLSTKEASKFIYAALENERNASMRNIIFQNAVYLFTEMQTEDTWKQLHKYFNIINYNDTAMHDFMIEYVKKSPPTYISEYIQNTYNVLKRTKTKEFGKKIVALAKNIPQNKINTVPLIILKDIITIIMQELLLHGRNEDCFWDLVLFSSYSRKKTLLCCVIKNMNALISDRSSGYIKSRITLNEFLYSFCRIVLSAKNKEHKEVVRTVDSQWSLFPKHCLMDTVIFLKITVTFYESEFDLKKFALLLDKLLHEYAEKYDSSIISKFCSQLVTLCELCNLKDDDLYNLTNAILQCNSHKFNYILVIMLLPKTFPSEDNNLHKWVDVIKSIETYTKKGIDTASVMLHYDSYLQEHRQDHIWIGDQHLPSVTTTKL